MSLIIDGEKIRIVFDEKGNLCSLFNKCTGTEYAGTHGLWRLIIEENESLEVEIRSDQTEGTVQIDGTSFRITYAGLRTHTGHDVKIGVTVTGKLNGEDLQLNIELHNHMPVGRIRECHFPIIQLSKAATGMDWHESRLAGFCNGKLCNQNFESLYKAMEYRYHRIIRTYPTLDASTNAFALAGKNEGLYFGCHDPGFEYTHHVVELEERKGMNLLMVKDPFLAPGQNVAYRGYTLSLYSGAWYAAADKYRAWAETWFDFKKIPPEIQTMNGWQRIIMRSQYGENFFKFADLPQIHSDGMTAGIDTIFIFGWHHGGHDADYPNYIPSEELGGKKSFRDNIAKFRAAGGKVILYSNGQLIDRNSVFYKSGRGAAASVKDVRGNEHPEYYNFSGRGVYQATFSNRSLVPACPTCRDWINEMKKVVDTAHELGCDGVFFDQLGNGMLPCGDPSHGHRVPHVAMMNDKREMVKELREYAKSQNPPLTFGIEILTDIISQHADYIHSLTGAATATNPNWEAKGEKPDVRNDMRWFRYIFPEVILTNREIRDDTDIERRVNRMLVMNLKADVEIYRCQKTIAETPHYQKYLAKVNDFRAKHADWFASGRYRAGSLHQTDNQDLDVEGYQLPGNEIMILATQSHLASTQATINVPGYILKDYDFFGEGQRTPDGQIHVGKHGVALLHFVKE